MLQLIPAVEAQTEAVLQSFLRPSYLERLLVDIVLALNTNWFFHAGPTERKGLYERILFHWQPQRKHLTYFSHSCKHVASYIRHSWKSCLIMYERPRRPLSALHVTGCSFTEAEVCTCNILSQSAHKYWFYCWSFKRLMRGPVSASAFRVYRVHRPTKLCPCQENIFYKLWCCEIWGFSRVRIWRRQTSSWVWSCSKLGIEILCD